MKHRVMVGLGLATVLLVSLMLCSGDVAAAGPEAETFTVDLPCRSLGSDECFRNETIELPKGRPVYAILVSGFHQNKELDMFHFYEFAKCLMEKDAYVHYAWWNNLLKPYMEGPLHDDASVPSHEAFPLHEIGNLLPWPPPRAKASPRDDYQFQADAQKLLTRIREENPDALIVLAGHSMGGDAVARLASNTDVEVALVAPIDPVGNRSCVATTELGILNSCNGAVNFTRWRATHLEYLDTFTTLTPFDPPQRAFGDNVKYLYHRWQHEFLPPFDYECGPGGDSLLCWSGKAADEYLFLYHDNSPPASSIWAGSANVQYVFDADLFSDREVYHYITFGGGLDGHGELVGFRGTYPDFDISNHFLCTPLAPTACLLFAMESYPLALSAPPSWPRRLEPGTVDPFLAAQATAYRMAHMQAWHTDPNYLYKIGLEPWNPGLCHVSRDLCNILGQILPDADENQPPTADAGPDLMLECGGPNGTLVTLDGSGSSDPEQDPLTFTWSWPGGSLTGEFVDLHLPLGTHTITLTVDDGNGNSDTDTVDVTVADSTPPTLGVQLSPAFLWPPNHQWVDVTASVDVVDVCDASAGVVLVSIVSSEPADDTGDGNTEPDIQGALFGTDDRTFQLRAERSGGRGGRTYTVTYEATDASGNVTGWSGIVTVMHDRGGRPRR